MRPQYEVADVLDQVWDRIEDKQIKVSSWQLRILRAIKDCRTSALGGHIDGCTSCGHLQVSYNSCRNRHCPKCQGHKKEQWIQARQAELLPAKYYHVVFTLPQIINTVAIHKPAQIYSMLFNAAWATIQDFGKDPKWLGGKMGMVDANPPAAAVRSLVDYIATLQDRLLPHLGTKPEFASTPSLHCSRSSH